VKDERGREYVLVEKLVHGQMFPVKIYPETKRLDISWLDDLESEYSLHGAREEENEIE
jgi:hypothetical protein